MALVSVRTALLFFFAFGLQLSYAQKSNPFHKFFGEWTLKDDNWSQNWGGGMEHLNEPIDTLRSARYAMGRRAR